MLAMWLDGPADHILPETTCIQARDIIFWLVTSCYKFIDFLYSERLRESWFLSRLTQALINKYLLTLSRWRKVQHYQVQIVSDTSCFKRKFKTICNSFVHISITFLFQHNTVICNFRISNVKDNEYWLFVLKIVPEGVFYPWVRPENCSWPYGRKRLDLPDLRKWFAEL